MLGAQPEGQKYVRRQLSGREPDAIGERAGPVPQPQGTRGGFSASVSCGLWQDQLIYICEPDLTSLEIRNNLNTSLFSN